MSSICNLFDINDFNRFCIQESTSFIVVHLNIRSVFGNNFDELTLSLNEIKPKFSANVLSEAFLPDENHPILEGYIHYAICINRNRNN